VVALLSVGKDGGSTFSGATGGAADSTKVDIELDPWAGLLVDHGPGNGPVSYRDEPE
jgi:hypothetical protein